MSIESRGPSHWPQCVVCACAKMFMLHYSKVSVNPFCYRYLTALNLICIHISFFAAKYLMVPSYLNFSQRTRNVFIVTKPSSCSQQGTRANDVSVLIYSTPNPWLSPFHHRETILVTSRVEHWKSCCTDSDSPSFNKFPQGDMGTYSTRLIRASISIKHRGSHTWRLGRRLSQSWRIRDFE